MRRKIISIICIITVSLAALPMVSCGESDEKLGTFYTLQEGYDLGLVDKDDLQTIADMHNNDKNFPEPFPVHLQEPLMKSYFAQNPDSDCESDPPRFLWLGYYGIYNRCFAVYITFPTKSKPLQFTDERVNVAGVDFHYTAILTSEGAAIAGYYREYILLWKEG